MKVIINENGESHTVFKCPSGLILNRVGVSVLTLSRKVKISGRQARKSLKAVKKTMKEHGIEHFVEIDVKDEENESVHIVI